MMETCQGTRRLYDSSQQKITAISKALCGVPEGLSNVPLFFVAAVVLLSTTTTPPSLINCKAIVEDCLYVALYAALRLQLA
jgi:hypothetical protein